MLVSLTPIHLIMVTERLLKGEDGKNIQIARKLIKSCPAKVYEDMISPHGGFQGAIKQEDNTPRISLSTMLKAWPVHVKKMSEKDKLCCGCERCVIGDELIESVRHNRTRLIKEESERIENMPNTRARREAEIALEEYKSAILIEGKHKYLRIRDVTKDICCERILVNERYLPKFRCAIGLCKDCPKYKPLPFEKNRKDHIRFNIFASRKYCTKHIQAIIDCPIDDDPYCTECKSMTFKDFSSFNKTPQIKSKKMRIQTSMPLDEFYKENGFYHKVVKEYLFHQLIVTCQSPSFFNKYRRQQFLSEDGYGTLMTVRDHADKWKMCANREIQTEHFVEDQALGIEGIYLELHVDVGEPGKKELRSMFYSVISDEKAQVAATVHENLRMMIDDLIERKLIQRKQLKKIFDISDVCGAQYRSGSVLYLLSLLCVEFQIVYDRAIQAPGHGKGIVDALNGSLKRFLNNKFLTEIRNPEDPEYASSAKSHKFANGRRTTLAAAAYPVICNHFMSPEDNNGRIGVNKAIVKAKERKVYENVCLLRPEGQAKGLNIKMSAIGFKQNSEKTNEEPDPSSDTTSIKVDKMGVHYSLRLDKELGTAKGASRIVTCNCPPCEAHLELPIEKRYVGYAKDCILRPVMEEWNNWKVLTFAAKKDNSLEEVDMMKKTVIAGIEESNAAKVEDGKLGAYAVNDRYENFYIVRWIGYPKIADSLTVFDLSGEQYVIPQGEQYCLGLWYCRVEKAKDWYYPEERETVVRMSSVLIANLQLDMCSDDNPLPSCVGKKNITTLKSKGVGKLSKLDEKFMLEEISRRELIDYKITVDEEDSEDEYYEVDDDIL